jgi:hypothetical protein
MLKKTPKYIMANQLMKSISVLHFACQICRCNSPESEMTIIYDTIKHEVDEL